MGNSYIARAVHGYSASFIYFVMYITVRGCAGDAGAYKLYKKNEAALRERYSASYAAGFERLCVGEGDVRPGIYEQLRTLAEQMGRGFEIDQRSIPICQEVVEICEFAGADPYKIETRAAVACEEEPSAGAVIIGRATNNNDKIIKVGETRRYLNRE